MAGEDIGESLVGSYLRHIEGCDVVVYNNYFRDQQGEVDADEHRHGRDFSFVINEEYTKRIQALVDFARGHSSPTGEPAYRLLQILTHLRGEPLQLRQRRGG